MIASSRPHPLVLHRAAGTLDASSSARNMPLGPSRTLVLRDSLPPSPPARRRREGTPQTIGTASISRKYTVKSVEIHFVEVVPTVPHGESLRIARRAAWAPPGMGDHVSAFPTGTVKAASLVASRERLWPSSPC